MNHEIQVAKISCNEVNCTKTWLHPFVEEVKQNGVIDRNSHKGRSVKFLKIRLNFSLFKAQCSILLL